MKFSALVPPRTLPLESKTKYVRVQFTEWRVLVHRPRVENRSSENMFLRDSEEPRESNANTKCSSEDKTLC